MAETKAKFDAMSEEERTAYWDNLKRERMQAILGEMDSQMEKLMQQGRDKRNSFASGAADVPVPSDSEGDDTEDGAAPKKEVTMDAQIRRQRYLEQVH